MTPVGGSALSSAENPSFQVHCLDLLQLASVQPPPSPAYNSIFSPLSTQKSWQVANACLLLGLWDFSHAAPLLEMLFPPSFLRQDSSVPPESLPARQAGLGAPPPVPVPATLTASLVLTRWKVVSLCTANFRSSRRPRTSLLHPGSHLPAQSLPHKCCSISPGASTPVNTLMCSHSRTHTP